MTITGTCTSTSLTTSKAGQSMAAQFQTPSGAIVLNGLDKELQSAIAVGETYTFTIEQSK